MQVKNDPYYVVGVIETDEESIWGKTLVSVDVAVSREYPYTPARFHLYQECLEWPSYIPVESRQISAVCAQRSPAETIASVLLSIQAELNSFRPPQEITCKCQVDDSCERCGKKT